MPDAAETTRERMPWVDMARGFCVVAVVLVHVGIFHAFPLAGDPAGRPVLKGWLVLNSAVLAELRMPLLLFVSGWLASTKVRTGLHLSRTRLAVLTNAYLFVVWSAIYALLEVAAGGRTRVFSDAHDLRSFLVSLVYPTFGPLWFVWLLAVATVALALLRRVPPWLVLLGLVALGWAVERWTGTAVGLPRAVFFAAGVYLAPRVRDLVESRRAVALSCAASFVFGAAMALLPVPLQYPASVLACVPLSIAFLALAKALCRVTVIAAPAAWIGRRTLGVYVLHWPLVGFTVLLGQRYAGVLAGLENTDALAVVYSLAVTAVIVTLCLLLDVALHRIGWGALFDPPAPLRRLVAGTDAPGPRT